jgi:hypothetical protein
VSWDLAFWKPGGATDDPDEVYGALAEDDEPDGLAWMSVNSVKAAFRAAFPDIADDGTELNWEGAGSYFQVTWPVGSRPRQTLGVLVTCGRSLVSQTEVIERLRSAGRSLGCGVYDPQSGNWEP